MWQDIAKHLQARTLTSPAGCWLWQRSHGTRGYGQVTLLGTQHAAHRLMLAATLGRWLDPGECACHRCDVKSCINPEHLFAGSHADNMRDAQSKGRLDKHAAAIRTALLADPTLNRSALARLLGCDVRTVFRVAKKLRSNA